MTTPRRRAVSTTLAHGWPSDLADASSRHWHTRASTVEWLRAQGVHAAPVHRAIDSPYINRVDAIELWIATTHPSDRYPGFPDQHWVFSSGLGDVLQAAKRASRAAHLSIH